MLAEYSDIEHIAFIVAMKIVEYKSKDTNTKLNEILNSFIMSCMEADRDVFKYLYKDDFEYALSDMKASNAFNVR
jgi:hypothetical protein